MMAFSNRFWRAAVVASLLAFAFIVMASVFSPSHTQADEPISKPTLRHGTTSIEGAPAPLISSDAHEGLRSLGAIETTVYIVQIYSTAGGPRYSIYDRISRRELGTLLTAEQVQRGYPEISLPAVDFSATGQEDQLAPGGLMIAEPISTEFSP